MAEGNQGSGNGETQPPSWQLPQRPSWEQPKRPSWERVLRGDEGAQRLFGIDLKLVIAVLIGAVSVTGAVVTWRSALLGEYATDKDRQAITETVRQRQDNANNEIIVQDARSLFADWETSMASAIELERRADSLDAVARVGEAQAARDEALELRRAADQLASSQSEPFTFSAFIEGDETIGFTFDEEEMRRRLADQARAINRVDPAQTIKEAVRLRSDSQRFSAWLIPLVSAVVLLTLAQVSTGRRRRLGLTGVAVVIWIGAGAAAFLGA
ncbi:MAG: hypothetical protein ACRD0G_10415 [Acidimicrobiales bacterium]